MDHSFGFSFKNFKMVLVNRLCIIQRNKESAVSQSVTSSLRGEDFFKKQQKKLNQNCFILINFFHEKKYKLIRERGKKNYQRNQ